MLKLVYQFIYNIELWYHGDTYVLTTYHISDIDYRGRVGYHARLFTVDRSAHHFHTVLRDLIQAFLHLSLDVIAGDRSRKTIRLHTY